MTSLLVNDASAATKAPQQPADYSASASARRRLSWWHNKGRACADLRLSTSSQIEGCRSARPATSSPRLRGLQRHRFALAQRAIDLLNRATLRLRRDKPEGTGGEHRLEGEIEGRLGRSPRPSPAGSDSSTSRRSMPARAAPRSCPDCRRRSQGPCRSPGVVPATPPPGRSDDRVGTIAEEALGDYQQEERRHPTD